MLKEIKIIDTFIMYSMKIMLIEKLELCMKFSYSKKNFYLIYTKTKINCLLWILLDKNICIISNVFK